MKHKILYVSALVFALSLAGGAAFAAGPKSGAKHFLAKKNPPSTHLAGKPAMAKPAVRGTVASVSGNIIGVNAKDGTAYSVDATGAKIMSSRGKMAKTLAVIDIKVGDTLMVLGTVSGTSVQATSILDQPKPQDRGQKVGIKAGRAMHELVGTVQTISGTNITVTAKDNTAFSVDASHAKILSGAGRKAKIINLYSIVPGNTIQISGQANSSTPTNFTASVIRLLTVPQPQN